MQDRNNHRSARLLSKPPVLAAFAACLIVWLATPTQWATAASVKPLSLAELTAQAEVIVVGEVGPQQSRKNAQGLILTDVEVNPERVIKGDVPVGAPLLVTHLGGVIGDIGLHVPGEVAFQEGEQALLFLRRSQRHDLRVVGMAQGKLQVTEEAGVNWVQIPRVLRLTSSAADLGQTADGPLQASATTEGKDSAATDRTTTVVPVSGSQPLRALLKAVQELL